MSMKRKYILFLQEIIITLSNYTTLMHIMLDTIANRDHNHNRIDLSTDRPSFLFFALLDWILIIIWKPHCFIEIFLTNYRIRR